MRTACTCALLFLLSGSQLFGLRPGQDFDQTKWKIWIKAAGKQAASPKRRRLKMSTWVSQTSSYLFTRFHWIRPDLCLHTMSVTASHIPSSCTSCPARHRPFLHPPLGVPCARTPKAARGAARPDRPPRAAASTARASPRPGRPRGARRPPRVDPDPWAARSCR